MLKQFCACVGGMVVGALLVIGLLPYLIANQTQPHSIFVYGTLENNFIRYYACRCVIPQEPATLTNYKQSGLNILPSQGDTVSGSIIAVSPTQLRRIDTYENVPTNYTRETVSIAGETHWVYLKNE